MANNSISKRAALNELWRRGEISKFKLDSAQKIIDETFKSSTDKLSVMLCSRRWGKTYWALTLAMEMCLKTPNTIVKYVSPTKSSLRDIIEPVINQILEDCPTELKPEYNKTRYTYNFQNGSRLQMAGTDSGHINKLRGGFAHLCIIDEAQSCQGLKTTIYDVLGPATITTRGRIVVLGTAPEDYEHYFVTVIEEADMRGTLIKRTIYDNPRLTKQDIEDIIKLYPGGANDPSFLRECLCKITKNTDLSAVPEFTEDLEKEIVKNWDRPPFYDYYEGMDLGGKDLTVVLFAYYDFKKAVIVVEDELVMDFQEKNNNIKTLTQKIIDTETRNFSNHITHEVREPFLRVSDLDYIALKEISQHSGNKINFMAAKKDNKQAAVNNLRVLLANKRIVINPRCQTLIRHLRNVRWVKGNRDVFDRSVDNGHYDAVDALIYLTRSIVFSKNPYPANYGFNPVDLVFNPNRPKQEDNAVQVFRSIFNIGKKYGR